MVDIEITDSGFSPECAHVNYGDAVTFSNTGNTLHSALTEPSQADSFDSGPLATGATYAHTFMAEGRVLDESVVPLHVSFSATLGESRPALACLVFLSFSARAQRLHVYLQSTFRKITFK